MSRYSYRCTITWSGPQLLIDGLLWVIVFLLTSRALPEELIWIAKWDHSKPLNGNLCCFYTLLCLTADTASQKAFLAKFGRAVGVSKALRFSWNYNWLHMAVMNVPHMDLDIDSSLLCHFSAILWFSVFFFAFKIIHNQFALFQQQLEPFRFTWKM